MHNNNAELDNGVYNENEEKGEDKAPAANTDEKLEGLKGLDKEMS